ncbi:MAG: hypothetical protein GY778_18030, partial [bacterium]|nr:hypothetical protein [bacterium]
MPSAPPMPPVEQLKGRQLGRILIKMGRVKRKDVLEALEIQKSQGGPIGQIFVQLGHVTEEDLALFPGPGRLTYEACGDGFGRDGLRGDIAAAVEFTRNPLRDEPPGDEHHG